MNVLKYVGIGVAALIALIAIVVGIVAATFDPNQYKLQVVELVKDKYDRTLTIAGPIQLTFFPRIGAAVTGIALSERDSPRPFAKVANAHVSLALLPLLARKVLVDRIDLDGLDVGIAKFKDGRTNFDDLLGKGTSTSPAGKEGAAASPLIVDVSGIRIRNGAFGYRDETGGTALRWSEVSLDTDRIASGIPGKVSFTGRVKGDSPKLDAEVKLAGGYRIEFDKSAVQLNGLDVRIQGDVAGATGLRLALTGDVGWGVSRIEVAKLKLEATSKDGLEAKLSTPRVAFSPEQSESAPIEATLTMARATRRIEAKLALSAVETSGPRVDFSSLGATLVMTGDNVSVQGKFATPLTLNLDSGQADLTQIAGNFTLTGSDIPNKSMQLDLHGHAQASWTRRNAQAELSARFDESNMQLKLDIADFAHPVAQLDLVVDRFNLDRYAGGAAGGAPAKGATAKGLQTAVLAKEEPIDLSALKAVDASGKLHIGSLVAASISAQNVDVRMKAANGVVELNPISAQLYQGSARGSASVDANGHRFALRQQMANVSVGPLMRDALGRDLVEGRGAVAIDVTTTGNVASALKRGLNGNASLQLRDGAIKGVDLGAIARKVSSLRSGNLESIASTQSEKTDFTELTATFVLRNGVAHNADMSVKSPFVRASGAGDIDIGGSSLDYVVKATIVATAAGQEGKALADLRGLTFPVKLTGPLDHVKYSVDAGALAAEVAKSELTRRLEEKVPKGALGDALKGLLGR
ncbi:MAG TPA: AsmA family protein [Casimicrobiaceae bacterium]|nr:AsmA family protein [Casimicrobiaceae bacterium]